MTENLYPGYDSRSRPRPDPVDKQAGAGAGPVVGGWVLGVPGGGLVNAEWAVNADVAEIGRRGEVRTAGVLDPLSSRDGAAVLHDLRIPIPGITANIDHIVVSGNRVLIIDTKVWRPGFFWSAGGKARRGLKHFPSAEKKTMVMAAESLGRFLTNRGIRAQIDLPVVAVWSSRAKGNSHFWALDFPGASVINATQLRQRVSKFLRRGKPADEVLVSALTSLLVTKPTRHIDPERYTEF